MALFQHQMTGTLVLPPTTTCSIIIVYTRKTQSINFRLGVPLIHPPSSLPLPRHWCLQGWPRGTSASTLSFAAPSFFSFPFCLWLFRLKGRLLHFLAFLSALYPAKADRLHGHNQTNSAPYPSFFHCGGSLLTRYVTMAPAAGPNPAAEPRRGLPS